MARGHKLTKITLLLSALLAIVFINPTQAVQIKTKSLTQSNIIQDLSIDESEA